MSTLTLLAGLPRRLTGYPVQVAAIGLAIVALVGARASVAELPGERSGPRFVRVAPSAAEPLLAALLKAGVTPVDAQAATDDLGDQIDIRHPGSGFALDLKTERSDTGRGLRLISLAALHDGRVFATVTRAADGGFRIHPGQPRTRGGAAQHDVLGVLQGPMEDVLYGAASDDAQQELADQATRLFAHRLDLTRDLALGDRVQLVFERRTGRSGKPTGQGRLLYAAIDTGQGATAFYRHRPVSGGADQFVDPDGETSAGSLLRTPLVVAHLTSGFGMRMHPLLGYSRVHEGVDFGAPAGTPVLAASDGVVEEARWAGGYGRWIKLRHSANLETGYGHLSAWAAGIHPGQRVRQGELIGYVGATGLATGPHLHFEVREEGAPIDPRTFKPEVRTSLSGPDRAQFDAEKAMVANALESYAPSRSGAD